MLISVVCYFIFIQLLFFKYIYMPCCCIKTIRKNLGFILFYFRCFLLYVCQPCNSIIENKNLLHWHLPMHFFLQSQVTLCISGSVMIHSLGINTESKKMSIHLNPLSTNFTNLSAICGQIECVWPFSEIGA